MCVCVCMSVCVRSRVLCVCVCVYVCVCSFDCSHARPDTGVRRRLSTHSHACPGRTPKKATQCVLRAHRGRNAVRACSVECAGEAVVCCAARSREVCGVVLSQRRGTAVSVHRRQIQHGEPADVQ